MSAPIDGGPETTLFRKGGGVVVNSRAELLALLRDTPLQLKPARLPLPPRFCHPDFIGPVQPEAHNRPGAIRFEEDGAACLELIKDRTERPKDAWLRSWGSNCERLVNS